MPLPEPFLDDLRFQEDLVDEARRRIIHYCPEWTDYNLSDPGITLIELFAWMTESIVYRLNRVPEKNYVKFLELLGVQLQPASPARVDLTFWLSAPLPLNPEDDTIVTIPPGTEVATRRTEREDEIVFTSDSRLVISAPQLTHLRRDQEFHKNYLARLGIEEFYVFGHGKPQEGDTFYLGFDENHNIKGYTLRLDFECAETQAVGVQREDPPLVWECSLGDGQWMELAPSTRPGEKDTTGGLNNANGSIVFYLPREMQADDVNSLNAFWIRCRLEQRDPAQGMYQESPRVKNVEAYAVGGTTNALHSIIVEDEVLGRSTGEPGQIFYLRNSPVLEMMGDCFLEVRGESSSGGYNPWKQVKDFSDSTRYDRHFVLDAASGEVRFGPSIRQRDGTVHQYGRIPEAACEIRFTRYRYGGGTIGNVPADKIRVLKTSIPYVDRVTNLQRASGGRDPESLDEAKLRARRELRAQRRAVTAQDYESFARRASRSVARVKCNTPGGDNKDLPAGMMELLIVPEATDSLEMDDLSKLHLREDLRRTISAYLEPYRLLTTTLRIREPDYMGIKVRVEIVLDEYADLEVIINRVDERLRNFIAPLPLSDAKVIGQTLGIESWEGWPFGRDLYLSEIYTLISHVSGVRHVWDVQVSQRRVVPSGETTEEIRGEDEEADEGLTVVKDRKLEVPADTLLCSLNHEVVVVEE